MSSGDVAHKVTQPAGDMRYARGSLRPTRHEDRELNQDQVLHPVVCQDWDDYTGEWDIRGTLLTVMAGPADNPTLLAKREE